MLTQYRLLDPWSKLTYEPLSDPTGAAGTALSYNALPSGGIDTCHTDRTSLTARTWGCLTTGESPDRRSTSTTRAHPPPRLGCANRIWTLHGCAGPSGRNAPRERRCLRTHPLPFGLFYDPIHGDNVDTAERFQEKGREAND